MFNIEFNKTYATRVVFVNEDHYPKTIEALIENKIFNNKLGEIYNALDFNNEGFIYLGLNTNDNALDEIKGLGFKLGNLIKARKLTKLSIDYTLLTDQTLIKLFNEGLSNAFYQFDYYKVKKADELKLTISFNNVSEALIHETNNVIKGINQARDLVNLTPIDLYPESYANLVVDLFKDTKVEVTVFDKKAIEDLKMDALLAVNKGSNKEPRFLVLKYFNDNKKTTHKTFVGKGVTYDSGGYAIKPAGSMASMKSDMAGSAAVVGALKAIALNELEVNVVGVIALTENMINGDAFKNGDVISSMKGTTIEVINTDAEGRVTLADAIYYAATKLASESIVELSTLTGACVVALGGEITGITTKYDELYNEIHEIGNKVDEFNWRMPITKSLENSVKSDIAELKNATTGGGGMMTAGIFLNHFAEDVPFIHLDIAGPSFGQNNKNAPKGATGVSVKTLYEFVK